MRSEKALAGDAAPGPNTGPSDPWKPSLARWRFGQALLLYIIALMAFALFARGWGSLHTDMTELWAWGKEFSFGYSKHPPLSAWLTSAWFLVFPRTNWAFYLLSAINGAVGLAGVWMLAGRFLDTRGRFACILFLLLTPAYSAWALKFNPNAVLLSVWPWTAYFFVRSLETRSARDGAALGQY
jgi:4-amino-4-deoxy-L-arabinose transferase-like glycosyltransferase